MIRNPALTLAVAAVLWAAGVPALAEQDSDGIAALDANNDGAISRQEALSAQVEAFHRLDADGNGTVSRQEIDSSPLQIGAVPQDKHDQRAMKQARRRWFENLDNDDNDGISLSEYQAAMTPYFDRLDGNGDGIIDAGELEAAYFPDEQKGGQ